MKTTIIEDLDLDDERRAALAREAARQNKPLAILVKEIITAKADAMISAAKRHGLKHRAA